MRDVAITGIGSTNFGKHEGRGLECLAAEAASAALSRTGVERSGRYQWQFRRSQPVSPLEPGAQRKVAAP